MLRRVTHSLTVGVLALALPAGLAAQQQVVGPYLQDVTLDSAWILWETSADPETIVEWGTDPTLGNMVVGTSGASGGGSVLHEAQVTGLAPNTTYHYRVRTGAFTSAVQAFRTPPPKSSDQAFSFLVITDTQDWSGGKFWEVVEQGMVPVACAGDATRCIDNDIAFVLAAGDLVSDGWNYQQYEERYFDPSESIHGRVPFYSVAGNHEADSSYYFDYVHLPENGTPGFEEHWWFMDWSNVRIIGLDSNPGYRLPDQLTWLDGVLADACTDPDVDFAFAMFHHGFKSELWVAGETAYSGDIVRRMEDWSVACDKPSGHFFGHTHGYSRGQSRDVSHVWMNAGTASGNIDYWGEYVQADYREFQRSFDEFGFTLVDVTAGMEPTVRLRRFSRGDEFTTLDNEVKDDLLITTCPREPDPPLAECPAIDASPDLTLLQGSTYSDPDGLDHLESHFQVTLTPGDYTAPVVDEWIRAENWWGDIDTQAGVDITQVRATGLTENTTYFWRMRYRNVNLCWSRWSAESTFDTTSSAMSPNLVGNPGAENMLAQWVVGVGVMEALLDGECGGVAPFAGTRYFAVGALCATAPYSEAHQRVDVSAWSADIDAGTAAALHGAAMRDWSGSDRPETWLIFRDAAQAELARTAALTNPTATWTVMQGFAAIPPGTRFVDVVLAGTHVAGQDSDCYFDEVFLQVAGGVIGVALPCREENCLDGLDDDGDGDVDCDDPDCDLVDVDGDLQPDCADCAPNDPGSFAIPPEIARLDVSKPSPGSSDAELAWTDVAAASGADVVHDVLGGRLDELHADRGFTRAACVVNDDPARTWLDARPLSSGEGYWYLVRAANPCGVGSIGSDSTPNVRSLPVTPCD